MEWTLGTWAAVIYGRALDKGWHDNDPPADLRPRDKSQIAAYCANLHAEVSELWEAYRAGKLDAPCDKADQMSEPLTCLEEELADIVIRALDDAVTLGVDIERAVRIKHEMNAARSRRHGGKLA